ncbi:MAG: VOC family protein [Ferruginibacter sp.]|nr:VOC family protein [Ferruginibacter sp.]
MKKTTAVGGIFFRCKNPGLQREWYEKHLGLVTDTYGTSFEWRHSDDSTKKGFTAWSPFADDTAYFGETSRQYMINYRVENLELLVAALINEGVTIVDEIENYEYGKFVHILDGEGNRVELWEPNDTEYEKMLTAVTK